MTGENLSLSIQVAIYPAIYWSVSLSSNRGGDEGEIVILARYKVYFIRSGVEPCNNKSINTIHFQDVSLNALEILIVAKDMSARTNAALKSQVSSLFFFNANYLRSLVILNFSIDRLRTLKFRINVALIFLRVMQHIYLMYFRLNKNV